MKVVLFALNSSYTHSNLAVRAIGASLERSGIGYKIIEKHQKDIREDILYELYEEKADVYGFSVYIWNVAQMTEIASDIKKLYPSCKVVFGGPEAACRGEAYLDSHPYIDYIITGEGEESFPALVKRVGNGEAGERIINSPVFSGFEESGIYYGEYGDIPNGIVYYESSRGCPFSCSYCLSSVKSGDGKVRMKSVEKTLSDLADFENVDGVKVVKLVDRTFNADIERAKRVWRGVCGEGYSKEYHFEVCASLLDEESISILSAAPKGRIRLEIGIQSTNPETLAAINRADTVKKDIEKTERLYLSGRLHVHADLIAGLPYEDVSRFSESFDALYGKCDVLQLGFLKVLRGCAIEKEREKYGIIYSDSPPYRVLGTDWLGYGDIMRLVRAEELLERYSNSGAFKYSFPYLPRCSGSAFGFFCSLYELEREMFGERNMSKLTQTEAYLLLSEWISRNGGSREARDRLALDYLLTETRRLPPFLRIEYAGGAETSEAITRAPRDARSLCCVCRMAFLSDGTVIIDRKNKKVITGKED